MGGDVDGFVHKGSLRCERQLERQWLERER